MSLPLQHCLGSNALKACSTNDSIKKHSYGNGLDRRESTEAPSSSSDGELTSSKSDTSGNAGTPREYQQRDGTPVVPATTNASMHQLNAFQSQAFPNVLGL